MKSQTIDERGQETRVTPSVRNSNSVFYGTDIIMSNGINLIKYYITYILI